MHRVIAHFKIRKLGEKNWDRCCDSMDKMEGKKIRDKREQAAWLIRVPHLRSCDWELFRLRMDAEQQRHTSTAAALWLREIQLSGMSVHHHSTCPALAASHYPHLSATVSILKTHYKVRQFHGNDTTQAAFNNISISEVLIHQSADRHGEEERRLGSLPLMDTSCCGWDRSPAAALIIFGGLTE